MKNYSLLLFALISLLSALSSPLLAQRVKVGAEILLEKHLDLLKGKQVGIICNHTSILPNGVHLVDTLLKRGVAITALFSPEHGIRGAVAAGETVNDVIDQKTGLPIFSLYGKTLKPDIEMLRNVNVLVFDLQDVGARFYTYASTMAFAMEAGAEFDKKFIVLDRPNPINGNDIEGPVLDMTLTSFFGIFPIPVRHGVTLGELAKMIVGEGYINPSTVDLTVIPMEGWKRSMWYDETGLPWVSPSPNMKTLATATVYPGTCLFEATNISEGRGTIKPFEYIGAPGLKAERLVSKLKSYNLPGVHFEAIEFTPKTDSIAAPNPKLKNKRCSGVYVKVTDRGKFKPVLTGVMMFAAIRELHPRKFQLHQGRLDHLIGDTIVGEKILKGKVTKDVLNIYQSQIEEYKKIRAKYLMY
ncbi:MAG: DUF1343 domain-containing protein [Ignavibacteriae bacterium]|nr:DUF1343 domain-containing protein [Ignavibacteriota bacterium]